MTVTKVGVLGSGIMGSGTATDLVELAACQLVIESVVEDLATKMALLAEVDRVIGAAYCWPRTPPPCRSSISP